MQWVKAYTPFWVAATGLVLALWVVYPYYQYYVDPDATAYLTLAQRYVSGDYRQAINGYWSPLSIWLTALLIKQGFASFAAAITVNAAAAVGMLALSQSLFQTFRIIRYGQWMLQGALSVFLLYAIFWQSFADLWGCFFLLAVLRLLLGEGFAKKPTRWVALGFLGALSYLAKAYAFPFFLLQIGVCGFFLTEARLPANRWQWLKLTAVCSLSLMLFSFPWVYLLHEKYGIWTTGTAGSLNTSWYLVGHPFWKDGIVALLPPVFPDSPSYWEDPFYANGDTPHFWHSPKLLLLQLVRIGYNILKLVESANELSFAFAVTMVLSGIILLSKKLQVRLEDRFVTLCRSFLLFPAGYLLINFQGRYLWYMVPLSMIIATILMQRSSLFHQLKGWLRGVLLLCLALSFMVQPILGLKEMFRKGEKEYRQALALEEAGVRGSFTTNIPYGPQTQNIVRLSYFSGCNYFNMPIACSKAVLLEEMNRYQVKYYFHFYDGSWSDFTLTNQQGQPFREIGAGKIPGIKVFQVAEQPLP